MITPLTAYILLHHDPRQSGTTVVISSHGKYLPGSPPLNLPANTTLYFTCKQNETSIMPLQKVMKGVVTYTETLTNGERKNHCPNYILSKFQDDAKVQGKVTETFDDIDDLLRINRSHQQQKESNNIVSNAAELSRLQALRGYRRLDAQEREMKAFLEGEHVKGKMVPSANMAELMDVITVEDARTKQPITVLDVITAAQSKNPMYRKFIGGFCRVLAT